MLDLDFHESRLWERQVFLDEIIKYDDQIILGYRERSQIGNHPRFCPFNLHSANRV